MTSRLPGSETHTKRHSSRRLSTTIVLAVLLAHEHIAFLTVASNWELDHFLGFLTASLPKIEDFRFRLSDIGTGPEIE